jgi:predicted aspartyl protease
MQNNFVFLFLTCLVCGGITGCLSNGSPISDFNMSCQDDSDCSYGYSCRSIISGGTECRAKENIPLNSNKQSNADEQAAHATTVPTVQSITPEIESSASSNSEFYESVARKPNLAYEEIEYNEVKITKEGGVYLIPAKINDVLLIPFVIDSGAADVSITPDVFFTLIKTHTIYKQDWLPGQKYQLADGSVAESNRFLIRTLQIGNRVLKNVTCSISKSIEAPMLLGQSALEQLGNFTFDYDAGVVRFQNNEGTYDDAIAAYRKGDFSQAVNLWSSLAENGDSLAQSSLGYMYDHGQGVTQDFQEAVKWYRLSAEQGFSAAQYNLALMYVQGLGVPLDYIRAYMLFDLAATQGVNEAQSYRDILAQQMTSSQIEEAQKIARECITRNYKNCD